MGESIRAQAWVPARLFAEYLVYFARILNKKVNESAIKEHKPAFAKLLDGLEVNKLYLEELAKELLLHEVDLLALGAPAGQGGDGEEVAASLAGRIQARVGLLGTGAVSCSSLALLALGIGAGRTRGIHGEALVIARALRALAQAKRNSFLAQYRTQLQAYLARWCNGLIGCNGDGDPLGAGGT